MLTIVHGSDLHFGKPHDQGVALAFLESARQLRPDLIVLSGDFTQRAKVREYQAARDFLRRLPSVPLVVTPGNHDVPLYRVVERLFAPYRNYRAFIRDELDTVTRLPGITVVSLNSSEPYRAIVNGRIGRDQLSFARKTFESAPKGDVKAVVAHHHLAPAPDYEGGHPLPGGGKILETLQEMGVELVMGGHLHRAYIGNSLDVLPGTSRDPGIVIVQSGTTTSRRGRARERARNSFNCIRIDGSCLEVTHYMHFEEAGGFAPLSVHSFPRGLRRWFGEEPPAGGGGEREMRAPGPRPLRGEAP
ncbi:MAG: 3',5'-cyclic-nucleotide phosphodiesterase [Gemmatimonadetes bacterium]|nr:3',5'-cyclic-nucleotide phosphodiesterase [Gemmatimonadota bacterium]